MHLTACSITDEEADGAKVRETAVIAQIEACNRSRNYDESIRLSHQLHVMRKVLTLALGLRGMT